MASGAREPTEFGRRLRWVVEDLVGVSGRRFAEMSGVSPALVGQYLRYENSEPSIDTATKFATAAEVDRMWLLTGEGRPRPDIEWPRPGIVTSAPSLTTEADPGQARTTDDDAWRTLGDVSKVFGAFARGRLLAATDGLEREQVREALNYAAGRLPRNYGGGEPELADVRRLYREGLAIVRDEDPIEAPPKVPERAAPEPAPAPAGETFEQRLERLKKPAKKRGR